MSRAQNDPSYVRRSDKHRCPEQAISKDQMKLKCPFLLATLALLALGFYLFDFSAASVVRAVCIVAVHPLSHLILMAGAGGLALAAMPATLTEDQVAEFKSILNGLSERAADIKAMPGRL